MAAHGHDKDHDHGTDAHAHDDFDPEPARELSPGEPTTPAWLPLLGVGLFLVGGIYFFASRAESGTPAAASASASAAPAPSVAAPPAPPRPPRPAPTARSSAGGTPIDAEKANQMLRDRNTDPRKQAPGAKP